ncbi:MAG: 3-oxoacyl-ACP reductase [Cellulomonadaceae bacterium]
MSDRYLDLVSSGLPATLAKKLGLPRPARLRRYVAGAPLVPGPVLVLGPDVGESHTDAVSAALLGWDLEVHRNPADPVRWGAVVMVVTEVDDPVGLSAPVRDLGSVLRSLAPGARIVTVSRSPEEESSPAVAATRGAVTGLLRSVAKELRGGATANGLLLEAGVAPAGREVLGPLHFLLSGRSAFVDGQLLTITPAGPAASPDLAEPPAGADRPLEGRVAVVTGAARGIGASIARVLARDGARIVAVDVPAAGESLSAVANEVRGTALQLDITAPNAGTRILEHARARHGGLDTIVHNAGITRDKLLANMTADRWDAVLAVNLEAQLRINAQLIEAGFTRAPRVVSLASTSGIAGNRGQTNYAASKAGVIAMVRATAPLLAAAGGTANAVAPGFIETEMTDRIPFVTREVARRLNSLQQAGAPIDVAEAVAFLASDAAAGVSGQVLRVCGQNMVGA